MRGFIIAFIGLMSTYSFDFKWSPIYLILLQWKNTLTVAKLMWVGGACQHTMFITNPNAIFVSNGPFPGVGKPYHKQR